MQGAPIEERSAFLQPSQSFDAGAFLRNVNVQPIGSGAASALMRHANLLQQRNQACLLSEGEVPLLVWRKTAATEQVRGPKPNPTTELVQRHLQQLGLLSMGRVDGWLGPVTQDALKQFQAKFNLPRSGEPDALTILLLENFHG